MSPRSSLVPTLAWLLPALLAGIAASLSLGLQEYAPGTVAGALLTFDGSTAHHVVRDLRLPRALIAPVAGASLGVAGVLIQTLVRNRIAAPDVLGLNAGAALAVVAATVLFGVGALAALSLIAAAGALLTALLIFAVAHAGGGARAAMSPARTVLAGITLAGLMISLVQVILTTDEATLDELLFWLAGAFADRPLTLLAASGWLVVLGLFAAFAVARPLDALLADEDTARGLGVPLVRVRATAFGAIAALTGGAVALAGPVGFIGLVAPHVARRLVGLAHRDLIPVAALVGAVFALLADVGARYLIHPAEVPVGVVTALVGAPVLIALLRRRAA
ncbi:iron ABC transporter permease [Salinarimonas sp.]|uniref:FecCD family ABC transporter permease n=1 Tax=Salinarimonas sp. TaxID=2766526 RepID=UPI0032D9432C